ncbi:MAG: hypothetical protein HC922_06190 [Leptolyngbyaceae cyanobacterium SM2_3_12]|nr:hypothetical protein [Leptolyngbyaceae cyanobacterium SM2_3_12]
MVLLWDVATGICSGNLDGHHGSPSALAFSTDSQWLVSGSRDCTIRIWDLSHKTCHHT